MPDRGKPRVCTRGEDTKDKGPAQSRPACGRHDTPISYRQRRPEEQDSGKCGSAKRACTPGQGEGWSPSLSSCVNGGGSGFRDVLKFLAILTAVRDPSSAQRECQPTIGCVVCVCVCVCVFAKRGNGGLVYMPRLSVRP